MSILGVVMAGGRNTRYGGLKAFEYVGGQLIVDRVKGALARVADDIVVIANDPAAYERLGLPMRPDAVEDAGPLGGLLTALRWAEEMEYPAAVIVACDMPFVTGAMLQDMVAMASRENVEVVIPESGGPRGLEPLCAYYSTLCIGPIEHAIARGDHRMIGFHELVRVARFEPDGDPSVLFLNVNTPADLETARGVAARWRE
jgi:molybdopterin-guanine dinucleotide biosynthesis protein A